MTKREIAFVLSLITTIISPLFLWFSLWWRIGSVGFDPRTWVPVATISYGLIVLIMITGLLFMGISKTKRGKTIGGTIILIVGIIAGILAFLTTGEEFRVVLSIPAVIATIGGCLGIQGAREDEVKKKQYPKAFIFGVSLIGFISVLVSVFVFFLSMVAGHEGGVLFYVLCCCPSLDNFGYS